MYFIMGLSQQDSMAVAKIVMTGLAFLIYAGVAASSSSTETHKKTTSHRSSSVGGKTRKRR